MRLKRTKRKFSIPWKIKSLIFSFIEYLNVPKLLCFFQKFVTRRSLSPITSLDASSNWQVHKDTLKKYQTTNLIFEFGGFTENAFLKS